MFDIPAAITAASTLITGVINRIFPDPTEEQRTKLEALKTEINAALQITQGQVSIIVAEAQGGGFLQRNWRPFTMLVFLGLIVGRFLGLEASNFGVAESEHLFSLVELGLGGYVVGRTVEKVAVPAIGAIKDMRR